MVLLGSMGESVMWSRRGEVYIHYTVMERKHGAKHMSTDQRTDALAPTQRMFTTNSCRTGQRSLPRTEVYYCIACREECITEPGNKLWRKIWCTLFFDRRSGFCPQSQDTHVEIRKVVRQRRRSRRRCRGFKSSVIRRSLHENHQKKGHASRRFEPST